MQFLGIWLVTSFVTFFLRYGEAVLDLKFFLGILFTGLLWAIGISVILFVGIFVIAYFVTK